MSGSPANELLSFGTSTSADRLPNSGSAFCPESGKFFEFWQGGPNDSCGEVIVTRFWPDPRCWRKALRRLPDGRILTEGWTGRGHCGVVELRPMPGPMTRAKARSMHARRDWNRNRALSQAPDDVLDALGKVRSECRWELLNLLSRAPQFRERLEHYLALVLLLAWHCRRPGAGVQRPYRSARALQKHGNRRVLEWMGLPAHRAQVKLLKKVSRPYPHPAALRALLLERDERLMERARHLPRLNADVLELLLMGHARFSSGFLRAVASWSPREVAERATDLKLSARASRLFRSWQRAGLEEDALLIESMEHMEELEAQLEEEGGAALAPSNAARSLPVPPCPLGELSREPSSSLEVKALDSAQALISHAKSHRNCIASTGTYREPIAEGYGAAFGFTWNEQSGGRPQRGTLFLKLSRTGRWEINEVQLSGNRSVPPRITAKLWSWLWRQEEAGACQSSLPAAFLRQAPPGGEFPDEDSSDPNQLDFPFAASYPTMSKSCLEAPDRGAPDEWTIPF